MKRIGTQLKLDDNERSRLMSDLRWWHRQVVDDRMLERREEYERAFNCVWAGQNAKGVRMDTDQEAAWPFEGASDQRLRWGEKVFLDYLSLILIAINSCEVEITCGGDAVGQERARALKLLLKSVMSQMGAKGYAEMMALFHYMLVDSPAVGALDVSWKKRVTMGVVELEKEALQAEYAASAVAMGGVSQLDAEMEFNTGIADEDEGAREAVGNWIITAKKIDEKNVEAVMDALFDEGVVETCCAVDENEGPEIKALRYIDDFCVPKMSDDFDYASPMFRGEWVTESQLRERVNDQDWDLEWVEETLKHPGMEIFQEIGTVVQEDVKNLYNLVWCYTTETDDEGTTTRYVSVLSRADGSAFGKRIIRTRRGKWNMAFFRREVRDGNILASRGLAELSAAPQGTAKIIRDMAANNSIVGSLPPVKAKGTRLRNVLIEPFAVLHMGQSDDASFMQPPAFPAAADKQEEKIKADFLEYVGVSDGEKDVTDRKRAWVAWFLEQWREFLILLLEVTQDNASDAYVIRATETNDVKGVKAQNVSGPFLITLKLDPTNIDNAKLIEKIKATSQFLIGLDKKGEIDTAPVVKQCFTMLFPELADKSFKSADELTADDLADEENNFVKIKAGVMPKMNTEGGWNYAARLEFWQRMQQENPDALAEMSPTSQDMMARWIAALEQQQTQFGENAQIGKTGVERVMSDE